MAAAAEDFKQTAIANLKEEAEVEGWAKESDEYKARFRAILAKASAMEAGDAAAAAKEEDTIVRKRVDPPWENKWKNYSCKDWKAMEKQLQLVQKGTWDKDKNHESYRTDKSKTKRWVSPDEKILVRVTERVAPKNMAMGKYELDTCPADYTGMHSLLS